MHDRESHASGVVLAFIGGLAGAAAALLLAPDAGVGTRGQIVQRMRGIKGVGGTKSARTPENGRHAERTSQSGRSGKGATRRGRA